MKHLLKRISKQVPKPETENTFTPSLGVDDAIRKQFFTIYDVDRVNQIRMIKLNHNQL